MFYLQFLNFCRNTVLLQGWQGGEHQQLGGTKTRCTGREGKENRAKKQVQKQEQQEELEEVAGGQRGVTATSRCAGCEAEGAAWWERGQWCVLSQERQDGVGSSALEREGRAGWLGDQGGLGGRWVFECQSSNTRNKQQDFMVMHAPRQCQQGNAEWGRATLPL